MFYSRLLRAIDLPSEHIKNDMEDFDNVLKLLNQEEDLILDMKEEDQKALKRDEEQKANDYNNNNLAPPVKPTNHNKET